jgi:starch phosphorylase
MDSLASSLEIPAIGYGIRYEFGIFDQDIRDGWQVEMTDKWLQFGNPMGNCPPQLVPSPLSFGGHTEPYTDNRWAVQSAVGAGTNRERHSPTTRRLLGYRVNTANTLRLWRSEAPESFDFQVVQRRRLLPARWMRRSCRKTSARCCTPTTSPVQGKELRLDAAVSSSCPARCRT